MKHSTWSHSPLKRVFDVACAAVLLLLAAPVLLLATLAVKIEDGGPIFFRQQRVGQGGRVFRMWKLRTMRPTHEGDRLLTIASDNRITKVGRLLRHTKIDELPQLMNVLTGDMTIVGPRPEVPAYVARYDAVQRHVLMLKPGLTDPASLAYSNEAALLNGQDPENAYVTVIMPDKVRRSLEYAARASFWTDIEVILRTAVAIWLSSEPRNPSQVAT
jgi:lipopolysaccharide/colanic/teichoic acid biosynthesis glycosyltransferase